MTAKRPRYSDEDMVRAMQALAARLGRTPYYNELGPASGTPARITYIKRFGTLAAARRAAGLVPPAQRRSPRKITAPKPKRGPLDTHNKWNRAQVITRLFVALTKESRGLQLTQEERILLWAYHYRLRDSDRRMVSMLFWHYPKMHSSTIAHMLGMSRWAVSLHLYRAALTLIRMQAISHDWEADSAETAALVR